MRVSVREGQTISSEVSLQIFDIYILNIKSNVGDFFISQGSWSSTYGAR